MKRDMRSILKRVSRERGFGVFGFLPLAEYPVVRFLDFLIPGFTRIRLRNHPLLCSESTLSLVLGFQMETKWLQLVATIY